MSSSSNDQESASSHTVSSSPCARCGCVRVLQNAVCELASRQIHRFQLPSFLSFHPHKHTSSSNSPHCRLDLSKINATPTISERAFAQHNRAPCGANSDNTSKPLSTASCERRFPHFHPPTHSTTQHSSSSHRHFRERASFHPHSSSRHLHNR
ncbi:hypothetical protein BLNAU_10915 [Blattamonas nauphoetae]|uniref:Uncharacterized protein n=1 Tax=Blattamonas nauphoetae TaxID=2049346 RepID=A0ABQ9XNX9_9EUKA|nr:hypothetical protein BLNAU_10915 [Blattamonas nauphoetae]